MLNSTMNGNAQVGWIHNINRRLNNTRPAAICVAVMLVLAGCRQSGTGPAADSAAVPPLRKMNLVVVTVDTLRADRLHCYGNKDIETPTLDSLAARGALFENAVAQTPLTPPSHASIFTGTNPNVHHVRNTGGFALQASPEPMAKILQNQGWDTAAFVGASVLHMAFVWYTDLQFVIPIK